MECTSLVCSGYSLGPHFVEFHDHRHAAAALAAMLVGGYGEGKDSRLLRLVKH